MIDQVEMMRAIEKLRGDAIMVPVFRANVAWSKVTNNVKRDIPVGGAMGKGSSFALGLALAQPDTKVILFDGDGSLLMNLGSLVTIANKGAKNLVHFVMDNGVYATTGGQEVPGAQVADYADLAKAAGYAHTYQFDNLEDFVTQAEEIFSQEGPVFVAAKVTPDIRLPEERAAGGTRRTPEAVIDLMAELGTAR
ncbi:MAG: thiamine pyrophosphate-binding protein [Chloroflexi bacterium]|nr:thiamine pyrophosphate-binding protein [Chloroflexota bacterium]